MSPEKASFRDSAYGAEREGRSRDRPPCLSVALALFLYRDEYDRRADTRVRPYDCNDAVNVVRHKDIITQFDMRKLPFRLVPPTVDHFTCLVQNHLIVDDLAEKTLPILRANRHEITSGLRIIVSLQPI